MKEVLPIAGSFLVMSIILVVGMKYLVEDYPCHKYGKMYNLPTEFVGRCYIKINGIWVSRNYHDYIKSEELDNQ